MQAPTGTCRVHGCGALISGHMLLCQPHWRLIPDRMRRMLDNLRRTAPQAPDEALVIATRYVEAYQLVRKQSACTGRRAHRLLTSRGPLHLLRTAEGFERLRAVIAQHTRAKLHTRGAP